MKWVNGNRKGDSWLVWLAAVKQSTEKGEVGAVKSFHELVLQDMEQRVFEIHTQAIFYIGTSHNVMIRKCCINEPVSVELFHKDYWASSVWGCWIFQQLMQPDRGTPGKLCFPHSPLSPLHHPPNHSVPGWFIPCLWCTFGIPKGSACRSCVLGPSEYIRDGIWRDPVEWGRASFPELSWVRSWVLQR